MSCKCDSNLWIEYFCWKLKCGRGYSINCWQLKDVGTPAPPSLTSVVRSMVLETERLVESRRLLEAHARLMDLEQWQDDILWQLHGAAGTAGSALSTEDQELVAKYFSGVGKLVDALGKDVLKTVSQFCQHPVMWSKAKIPFMETVSVVYSIQFNSIQFNSTYFICPLGALSVSILV